MTAILLTALLGLDRLEPSWSVKKKSDPGLYIAELVVPVYPKSTQLGALANSAIDKKMGGTYREFLLRTKEDFAEFGKPTAEYWHETVPTVSVSDSRLISVFFSTSFYTGGAHPNRAYTCFNFGMVDGAPKQLSLSDLFREGVDARKVMWDHVEPQLIANEAMWVTDGEVDGFTDRTAGMFVLTPTSISYLFSPYEMGPYVQGEFFAKVKYSDLADFLDPNGPLAQFLKP